MINSPTVLSGMSHEVRTYMNAIVAFSFLMNRDDCDETDRDEYNRQILYSCEQLIGLFDNFLDSAIMDSGNAKSNIRICRINNLIGDLYAEFREMIGKEQYKDISLIEENNITDTSEVIIDSNRVLRVIRNLFQNALKNTKSGYIKLGYYFRDDKMTFYVLDSGQGYFKCKEFLHTEDINESLNIYNDTFTAVNITLAKKLTQFLGGSIWIECNGLTGTGLYFSVPAKVAENPGLQINKFLNSNVAI